MPHTPTGDLVRNAVAIGVGIGAFNVISLESAEGFVSAAERTGLPIILQISENCARYHGGLGAIAAGTLALAAASSATVAVHLDHATDEELALQAIDLGFGSVMFDGATLDYAENVAATRRVVDAAHSAGAFVEAELGEIGGKDGAHAPGRPHRPGRGSRLHRRDRGRRPRRRRRVVTRHVAQEREPRPRSDRPHRAGRPGSAGASRVERRAR
jgi:fructose-bisphosphate aldolase class II